MENKINVACNGCDYFNNCRKALGIGGDKIPAKHQDKVPMRCQNVVQHICRDCKWYLENKCASWLELNGKKSRHVLKVCPKKVTRL